MKRLFTLVTAAAPWAIIVALFAAALFIKPAATGATVQPPPIAASDRFYGVAAPAPNLVWVAGSGGKIVRSDDAGANWQVQSSGTRAHLQSIAAWDAQRAVAVGNEGVVLMTADGGMSWRRIELPAAEVGDKLLRVRALAGGTALAVGTFGAVLKTTDYGATWWRVSKNEDIAWNDVTANADAYWIVGEFGRIRVSRDGGTTWQEAGSPVKSSLTGIAFRDARHGVAVGLEGVVLATSDGGREWRLASRLFKEHLYTVIAHPGGWWMVGDKSWVATGDASGRNWKTQRLGHRELAWHTDIALAPSGAYLAGANLGLWDGANWRAF
jgi:photosystem II stability/assembly factor-like uncharacterized protein